MYNNAATNMCLVPKQGARLLCKQAEQKGDAGMLGVNGVGRRGKHSRIPNGKIYKCIQKSL